MTAYEAFGRVVADRGSLPEVRLWWPAETVHAPEDLAAMREACERAEIGARRGRRSDPSIPLQGVEQTKWTPAWVDQFRQLAASLRTCLINLAQSADAFGAAIGFPPGSYDYADIPRLVKLGDPPHPP